MQHNTREFMEHFGIIVEMLVVSEFNLSVIDARSKLRVGKVILDSGI